VGLPNPRAVIARKNDSRQWLQQRGIEYCLSSSVPHVLHIQPERRENCLTPDQACEAKIGCPGQLQALRPAQTRRHSPTRFLSTRKARHSCSRAPQAGSTETEPHTALPGDSRPGPELKQAPKRGPSSLVLGRSLVASIASVRPRRNCKRLSPRPYRAPKFPR
jgi:hypothetical protein